ncbi:Subtilisin-like protease 4 [Linum perenne]
MAENTLISSFFLLSLFLTIHIAQTGANTALRTYIVHVSQPRGRLLSEAHDIETWHRSFLPTTTITTTSSHDDDDNNHREDEDDRMLYSYHSVMSGFSARLTPEEVKSMQDKNHFISARLEKSFKYHTTHSPSFLGLQQRIGFWPQDSNFGKGVIIGVLDGGVLPTHPSFNGQGMPLPPAKWKGKCEFKQSSLCNNKLIGARSFNIAAKARNNSSNVSEEEPFDINGHGTHTASTAAGAFVSNADTLGNARGTAAGIAPSAHLAIYKVCFPDDDVDCAESDILAGLDAAIRDGVDVLSISMGNDDPRTPIFEDAISVGTFAAIEKGIFVSTSAGNSGPFNSTLSNEAPWLLTVGATTLDRKIVAMAKLGNGEQFDGQSTFQPKDYFGSEQLLPLVFAGTAGSLSNSSFCGKGSLDGADVKGKIVVCERGGGVGRIAKGQLVKDAGGAAMILVNTQADGFSTLADLHVLPAAHLNFVDGEKIKAYLNSTTSPIGMIMFKGTVEGDSSAPSMVSFSSRGPTTQSKGILKPDIIGPGANILAAWPFSLENSTVVAPTFNIISGTSMSCPHLSGVAALLKSSHPSWSPAAIKSAMMTTTDVLNMAGKPIVDENYQPANVFATGSGHVNPTRANNPGLIYDIKPEEYISYLCGLGYTDQQVEKIVRRGIKCGEKGKLQGGQLNYPSFSVALGPSQTFSRSVTNVGAARSVYVARINPPYGVLVTVRPSILKFSQVNQLATYAVTFTRDTNVTTAIPFGQGSITWTSDNYSVRSPISVTFQ